MKQGSLETFRSEPAGVSPARRRRPPAGSESCVEARRLALRSVDSKRDRGGLPVAEGLRYLT